MFIQLTKVQSNEPVWINFDKVTRIDLYMDPREITRTRIHFTETDIIWVNENPLNITKALKERKT